MRYVCPKCGIPLTCGCAACAPRNPPETITYKATKDGEGYTCGKCGFTASADWWLDYEMKCLKESGGVKKRE